MFGQVTITVSDREASERFYDTVLATLGVRRTDSSDGRAGWGDFSLTQSAHPEVTRRLHIGFVAPSRADVDEFWRAGTAAGYRDDGAPGPRPQYLDDYYGAFLLDPDGNSAEAVHHGDLRQGGNIDHLWLRVADVRASKRFYEAIAPRAGFRLDTDLPERASFVGGTGTFSVVAGEPTENLYMAFPAEASHAAVDPDGNEIEMVNR